MVWIQSSFVHYTLTEYVLNIVRILLGRDTKILNNRSLQILMVATIPEPLGLAILSPILATLAMTFDQSVSTIGLLMAVFTAPALFVIPLAGSIADRIGRKPVLLTGLVIFGSAGSAISLVDSFYAVVALRFVQGIGVSGIGPIIITSIGDLFNGTEEDTALGYRLVTIGITQATFPLAAGLLVLISWRLPFVLFFIALPIALVVALWLREPTATPSHKGAVVDSPEDLGTKETGESVHDIVSKRPVGLVLIARGLPPIAWTAFLTYNSFVILSLESGTGGKAGALVTVGSISYAFMGSQVGRISGFFRDRYAPLMIANLFLGLGLLVFSASTSFIQAMIGVVIMGLGFGITNTLFRSLIANFGTEATRGSLVSIGESIGWLSITLTPVLLGLMIGLTKSTLGSTEATRWALAAAAVLIGVAGILLLNISRRYTDTVAS